MQNIGDMPDADFQTLLGIINSIMQVAEAEIAAGNSRVFNIYRLARDGRDLLAFDADSRDVLRKLGAGPEVISHGYVITSAVMAEIAAGRRIGAIKELRATAKCGLAEAKDAVEAIWDKYAPTY